MFFSPRRRPNRRHRGWISISAAVVVVAILSAAFTLVSAHRSQDQDHHHHLVFQDQLDTATGPTTTAMKCRSWDDPQKVRQLVDQVFAVYTTREPTTQWSWIQRYYSPNVQFEDPLMVTQGSDNYRVQFLSLIKFFQTIDISWNNQDAGGGDTTTVAATATTTTDPNTPTSGYTLKKPGTLGEGTTDIVVPNRQVYRFARESWLARKLLPDVVDLRVDTTLTVRDSCAPQAEEMTEGVEGVEATSGTATAAAGETTALPQTDDEDLKQVILRHQDVWPDKGPEKEFYTKHVKPVVGRVTSGWFKLIGW